jgi:hypothetical protein
VVCLITVAEVYIDVDVDVVFVVWWGGGCRRERLPFTGPVSLENSK